jgi:hypothetical protein
MPRTTIGNSVTKCGGPKDFQTRPAGALRPHRMPLAGKPSMQCAAIASARQRLPERSVRGLSHARAHRLRPWRITRRRVDLPRVETLHALANFILGRAPLGEPHSGSSVRWRLLPVASTNFAFSVAASALYRLTPAGAEAVCERHLFQIEQVESCEHAGNYVPAGARNSTAHRWMFPKVGAKAPEI